MRKFTAVAVLVIGIGGCSTVSPPPEPDNSPLLPAAVIEVRTVNEGIKGLFPYESNARSYVRATMRRDDVTVTGTGTVTKYIVGKTATARIARLDRDVLWLLHPDDKEYSACPLKGCVPSANPPPEEPKPAQPLYESGCTMKIARTHFSAKPTGKKREISGFGTDEYLLEWKVVLQDIIARKTTSTLSVSLWTTPVSPALRQVMDIEHAYHRAFAGKVAGTENAKLLPPEIIQMVAAGLSGALSPRDRATFLNAGKQFEKVKGHPISTRVEWTLQGDACAPKETENSGLSSITGMFSKKKKDAAGKVPEIKPILSFLIEVKAMKMDLVRDSAFNVPKDYRQVNPR